MKSFKFRWAVIAFLVAWSVWEIYPPTSTSLIQEFKDQADSSKIDTNFNRIVSMADAMYKTNPAPQREFGDLISAIGTNDIHNYFPDISVQGDDHPTYTILNELQRKASGKIKLGLDLQGGTQFLISLDTNHLVNTDTNGAKTAMAPQERGRMVSQAVEVLRRRVDGLGVAEPVLQPSGENHILIQLPGLSQAAQDQARDSIKKAAYLEFRLVHPESDQLLKEGIIEPGYEVLTLQEKSPNGTISARPYLVSKRLANGLTGKYIKRAFANRGPMGEPEIDFTFDSAGAEKFAQVTRDHVHEQLAIVLDGKLYSAPVINGPITGGSGSISGGQMDIDEAIRIANVLQNPLETPVSIDSQTQVDPTLGKDSISAGIKAAVWGTLLVAAFMIFYYHRCGLIADIAMILNLLILLGVMCSIGTTLTLPGIAGIVLTVGMAVDANVLIYERLREEMTQGKSMRGAIDAAYKRAFGTIFDSHTTTLISAFIMIWMGTGPIKGFGVTLAIGVALSLFTSLFVTRLIFDVLLAKGWLNKIGMQHWIKNPKWDFMKWAKPAVVISCLIIIGGWTYAIGVRGNNVRGIDFAGGDSITYTFNQKVDVDQLRKALTPLGDVQIQYQKADERETLHVVAPEKKGPDATVALEKKFPAAGFKVVGSDTVGATVGLEIEKSAILAAFASMFGILIYVAMRYEFSFAVGAILAVVHDVLISLAIFFISGRQLSAPIVAAVLTIIGFSLNDKVVVFDRIREDLKLGVRGTFREVMNVALGQTLSRTIITSGTVFIATGALYFFGGGVINDFAFLFLVGIITGTYSSIYIASAVVLWWHKGERPKSASQVTMGETAGARARV